MEPIALPLVTELAVSLRFVAGVAAGVLATLAMDLVMARLPEGETPPLVASGVLTETNPVRAPQRVGTVVHYLAGGLTGPLFVWLLFTLEAALGAGVPATVAAGLMLYALMVGFFAVVVLPRSSLPGQRLGTIRRDWALAAAAYCLVLVPAVAAASFVL
jgi:uncharacterized membrane protein YdcZ (DUF606 family)